MSVTLGDLHVVHQPEHDGATGFMRCATIGDLIEALQAEGYVVTTDSSAAWLAAIDDLGWQSKGKHINGPELRSLLATLASREEE